MSRTITTWAEVRAEFLSEWAETCRWEPQWIDDVVAKREAWCNFVDMLNKNGIVSDRQAASWSNPF